MQIISWYYILIMLAAPLVLRGKNKQYVFLTLNLAVFYIASGSLLRFLCSLVYVLVPYVYIRFFKKRWPLYAVMIALFLYMKRYDWIFVSLGIPYLIPFEIFGLSYIVFRIIDYTVNYEFMEAEERGIVDYLNYLLSFYTLICGPINSFAGFREDFYSEKPLPDRDEILNCFNRIAGGYVKILLLSNLCGRAADYGFGILQNSFSFPALALFAAANVWFIYFNFTGYCDVVIAFARLAGFTLPENFNKPYLANDLSDFWNRQHITLTRWITSYLFTPAAKNLSSKMSMDAAQYIAFFVAFLIAGLWHGTSVDYLAYGILQAVGVCLRKLYVSAATKMLGGKKQFREFRQRKGVHIAEIAITQLYVYLSFTFIGYNTVGLIFGGM